MSKALCGLAVTKIIALYTGPAGVALLGQMGNAMNLILPFTNGGIGNGIVKYIAEYNASNRKEKIANLINTTLSITLLSSVIIALPIFFLSGPISLYLFENYNYSYIFKILSVCIPFMAFGHSFLYILNGYKKIKVYAFIGIANSVLFVAFSFFLTIPFGIPGVLISVIATHTCVVFITGFFIFSKKYLGLHGLQFYFDKMSLNRLMKFALMGLVSAAVAPISQIVIRTFLIRQLSIDQAGYWQAVWRLSEIYISMITMPLAIYYFPRLAEIHNISLLKKELKTTFLFSVSLALFASAIIFVLRDWIILTFFSPDFIKMKELFTFQLIGNVIKVGAWTIGMIMWAKAMTRLFIFTEILFSSSLVAFSILFLKVYGLVGITYAYSLNFGLYFLFLVCYFSKSIFFTKYGFKRKVFDL